ncbi:PfkB family carbohydrate kinase [Sinomonas sp. P47F7]|uniref:PfkB family carbohydrate kinase n=1 Tax=Sinomonas sp. P47F7 TaxID=3410987 RepID=UPI003BF5D5E7
MVGEALTDIIRTPSGEREHPGGSPANVALGLARLGVQTSFLTAIAPDPRGQAIAAKLAASGVVLLPESWSLPRTSTARCRDRTR